MNPTRALTTLITLCLAFGFASQPLRAATSGLFTYTDHGSYISIDDYPTSATGEVNIPTIIANKAVTVIGYEAFKDCANITSVNIPNGVTRLEYFTFGHCSKLAFVSLPASLTSIGIDVFHSCPKLTNVSLPAGLTSMEAGAFYGCGMTSVSIPASVTSIGSYAFQNCASLTSATFLGNAPTMGVHVFTGTASGFTADFNIIKTGFTAPTWNGYPSSASGTITVSGFTYSGNSTGCTLTSCPTNYSGALSIPSSINGVAVSSIGPSAFMHRISLESVIIPNSVTSLGTEAFRGCRLLAVTIPASVTGIGSLAFYDCSYLQIATFQGDAPTMGTQVFKNTPYNFRVTFDISKTGFTVPAWNSYPSRASGTITVSQLTYTGSGTGCTLTNCPTNYTGAVAIPSSINGVPVASIGESAFNNCPGMTSVSIPAGVTSIGNGAFQNCSGLTSVTFDGNPPTMDATTFSAAAPGFTVNFDISKAGFTTPTWNGYPSRASGTVTVSQLTYMANGTSCTLTNCPTNYTGAVAIPSSINGVPVTGIGNGAFQNCSNLTSVTIPVSVTSIGNGAFQNCTSLTSATFYGNAPTMGTAVFNGTASGFTVFSDLGTTGFSYPTWNGYPTSGFNTDYYPLTYTTDSTGVTITDCDTSYSGVVTIPNSFGGMPVISIGDHAFSGCIGMTSITLPAGLTRIGHHAFQNGTSLTSMNLPAGVTSIGAGAFQNCSSLNSVNIPEGVTSIEDFTFNGCNLENVNLPAGLTHIGNSAFESGVVNVNIPDGVTRIGDRAFYGCRLSSVSIPNSVTSLGDLAFMNCSFLTHASIGSGVTRIGDFTFYACESMTSLSIGSGVTSIGALAFAACINLPSVTIPDSVTSIEYSAFASCFSLTSVTIPASVTDIADEAFQQSYLSAITFLGNAPHMGYAMFGGTAPDFTVYFDASKTGFTESPWIDYPSSGQSQPQMWRLQYFGINSNTGNAADNADPDRDGIKNLLERAFNLNPNQPGLALLTAGTGTSGLPLASTTQGPSGQRLFIQYLRRKASTNPGLSYVPQFSSNLNDSDWSAAAGIEAVQSINSEWERVTIEDTDSGTAKRFARVKVITAP